MKNKTEFSKQICELLANDKTSDALDVFHAYNKQAGLGVLKELILLQSQLSRWQLESILAISENKSQQKQTINANVFDFLRSIEDDSYKQRLGNRYKRIPQDESVRTKLKDSIAEYYLGIYSWHKKNAKSDYNKNFGFDIAISRWGGKYFSFLENMKDLEYATLEDIVEVANQVINGRLGWSSKELDFHSRNNLYKNAYCILYLRDNATIENMNIFESFEKEAKRILLEKNDTLFKIEYGIDPYKKLGGLTTVLTLNNYWDKTHIYTPFLLGLHESDNENDIVMLIKANKISILNMEFNYANFAKENKAQLFITLQNETASTINGRIRNGQLFEDSKKALNFQILATCDNYTFSIEEHGVINLTLNLVSLTPKLDVINSKDGLISCFYFEEKALDKKSIDFYFNRWIGLNKVDHYKPIKDVLRVGFVLIIISTLIFLFLPYFKSIFYHIFGK